MTGLIIAAFVYALFTGGPVRWALTGPLLAEGQFYRLLSHMFAHLNLSHLWFNLAGLLALSPVVYSRFGKGWPAWSRYSLLYFGAGLAGAILFLAFHPTSDIPMLGASGAIFGLWGAASRVGPEPEPVPLWSRQVGLAVRGAVVSNLAIVGLLFVLTRTTGGGIGLAWEAHLGGFLAGLFLMPYLMQEAGVGLTAAAPTSDHP
ncbi:rhomboid family intramembrane serine protease [Brevundimonas sp. A19_0]|uniref:rhomboid family intramembrane serine protease n=1 Tax=Brevundimonas sp. A19_0 TaxID=2821087 RepID=UPI001ADB568B|nr:rhomboid family intramembrane serine protease [Brevundimonas sp. A19_0]MBO9500143.1 rhomboid family intramembrane serine protease [Brevundimonas sp. A19_0]